MKHYYLQNIYKTNVGTAKMSLVCPLVTTTAKIQRQTCLKLSAFAKDELFISPLEKVRQEEPHSSPFSTTASAGLQSRTAEKLPDFFALNDVVDQQ